MQRVQLADWVSSIPNLLMLKCSMDEWVIKQPTQHFSRRRWTGTLVNQLKKWCTQPAETKKTLPARTGVAYWDCRYGCSSHSTKVLHGLPQIPKSVPAFAVVATVIKHLEESLLKNLLHHVCRTNSRGPLRPSQWPDQRRSEKRRQMLRNKCDQIWRNFTTRVFGNF